MPAWLLAPRTSRAGGLAGRLAVPVVEALEAGQHSDAAKADLVRTRVVADVVRLARPVDETGDPARARGDAVGDPGAGRTRDHVAGAELVRLEIGRAACRDEE